MDKHADFNNLGEWWNPFSPWYEGKSKDQIALTAFEYFIEYANDFRSEKNMEPMTETAQDLLKKYGKTAWQMSEGIVLAEVSEGDVESGMERTAIAMGGRIPARISSFVQGIQGEVTDTAVVDKVIEVTEPIHQVTQKVATISTKAVEESLKAAENVNKYWLYTLGVVGVVAAVYGVSKVATIYGLFKRGQQN